MNYKEDIKLKTYYICKDKITNTIKLGSHYNLHYLETNIDYYNLMSKLNQNFSECNQEDKNLILILFSIYNQNNQFHYQEIQSDDSIHMYITLTV